MQKIGYQSSERVDRAAGLCMYQKGMTFNPPLANNSHQLSCRKHSREKTKHNFGNKQLGITEKNTTISIKWLS
jgi:hypothetical protein